MSVRPLIPSQAPEAAVLGCWGAFSLGAAGAAREGGPGTDFHATASGYVSVTPLQIDLTHTDQLTSVNEWLAAGPVR